MAMAMSTQGGTPPGPGVIISDDLSVAGALTGTIRNPMVGTDTAAVWAAHPDGAGAATALHATAGNFELNEDNVTGQWMVQDLLTGPDLVIECSYTGLVQNIQSGVIFWASIAPGDDLHFFSIVVGGTGAGGQRLYDHTGSVAPGTRMIDRQPVAGGVTRVEVSDSGDQINFNVKYWTDYLVSPAESGAYFNTVTIARTANHGLRAGYWVAGGLRYDQFFGVNRFRVGDLGAF